jgi:hypothetical protein
MSRFSGIPSQQLLIATSFVAFAFLASSSTGAAPVLHSDGTIVIEAEDMTLTSGEIVQAEDASGGKAVKVLSDDAVAEIELELPAGHYVVNAYFYASHFDHDGFFIAADSKVNRTNAAHHERWVYGAKFLVFETDGTKPVTLRFAASWEGHDIAESGMLVDRLELAELCSSADVLERWTR